MKLPSFKFGGNKEDKPPKEKKEKKQKPLKEKKSKTKGAAQENDENSSGEKPAKGLKKRKFFKVKGFGFVLLVLIVAAIGIGGVAYGYMYFTGGLQDAVISENPENPENPEPKKSFDLASLIPKPKKKEIVIDGDLAKLLDMYNLQNVQAGKIEDLQEENTELVEKTEKLEYTVKVYKTEVEKMEPGKSEEIEAIVKEGPPKPPPSEAVDENGNPTAPKPLPTFDEPEGGWETNEKIAEKLSDGTVSKVESWNTKFGGWVCVGIDQKRYLIIPSGTAIEASKLGL